MKFRGRFEWILAAGWLAAAAGLGAQTQKIEYSVEQADDSLFSTLRASVNGKTYTLIDKSKEQCVAVADQRDWNGDGLKDALVERITACGGNCCPNMFFFVSAMENGKFSFSKDLADSWADPVIEKWKNRWSAVIVSNNEGSNTDQPVEVRQRFILDGDKGVQVEESRRKDMPALLEMRSEIFKGPDDEHHIAYDLDGDGKKDVISGKFWERWGRMFWSVRFANGKEFKTGVGCKRIGVLPAKTRGVNDLVCDQDTVFRWNGTAYQETAR